MARVTVGDSYLHPGNGTGPRIKNALPFVSANDPPVPYVLRGSAVKPFSPPRTIDAHVLGTAV